MANGDKANAVGWTTAAGTDDLRTGYDKINYVADRVAEQYTTLRDTVLPAINQPIFAVRRSSSAFLFDNALWRVMPASVFASPILNDGFTSWSGGQLTIKKSGAYRLGAHFQIVGAAPLTEIQVVKNTTTPDTVNTLIKDTSSGRGATASDLVRLVAGDVLVVLAHMDDGHLDHPLSTNPYDLSLSVEWVRA